MFEDLNKLGVMDEVDQKKMTVVLSNAVYGCNWGILEKDQDFLNEEDLIELKDGYVVLLERGTVIKALYAFESALPKKLMLYFGQEYEKSLERALTELKNFNGGKIAIFGCSSSPIAFCESEQIPCYAVDFDSILAICKKYGLSLVLGGSVIPMDVFKNEEKKKLFLKGCELSGNGDSVVIEVVKS